MSHGIRKLITDMDEHGKLKGEIRDLIKDALEDMGLVHFFLAVLLPPFLALAPPNAYWEPGGLGPLLPSQPTLWALIILVDPSALAYDVVFETTPHFSLSFLKHFVCLSFCLSIFFCLYLHGLRLPCLYYVIPFARLQHQAGP
jgi:hypothetical protein